MCSLVRKGHLYVQLALRRIPYIRGEHVSRACNTLAVLYLSLIIILVKRIRLLFSGKPEKVYAYSCFSFVFMSFITLVQDKHKLSHLARCCF